MKDKIEDILIEYYRDNIREPKLNMCFKLLKDILNEYNKNGNGDFNNLKIIAKEKLFLPEYNNYRRELEKIIPEFIRLIILTTEHHRAYNTINIDCDESNNLVLRPGLKAEFIPLNSFDELNKFLFFSYADGGLKGNYGGEPAYKKLKDNLDIADLLLKIIYDFHNRFVKQVKHTKEIIESSKKIFIKQLKESEFFKSLTEKKQKALDLALKKLDLNKPKSKKIEDLIKHYLKIAYNINEIPTMRQLDSNIYSGVSYSRKLKNIGFVCAMLEEINKRFNNKKLSMVKKDMLIKIKLYFVNIMPDEQNKEKEKTGVVNKNKPDYIDNINNEIKNEFDNLQ